MKSSSLVHVLHLQDVDAEDLYGASSSYRHKYRKTPSPDKYSESGMLLFKMTTVDLTWEFSDPATADLNTAFIIFISEKKMYYYRRSNLNMC